MVMLVICFAVLAALFLLQGDFRKVVSLLVGVSAVMAGALAWAARTMGSQVFERFGTLVSSDPTSVYQQSRGIYLQEALGQVLFEYPLGYGLGWWGTVHAMFADPNRKSLIWVEVMVPAWVYDGGFPLLIGYGGAVVVAILSSMRVALTSRDRELAFWAAVVAAQDLGIAASCFSYVTFLTAVRRSVLAARRHDPRGRRDVAGDHWPASPAPRARARPPGVVA